MELAWETKYLTQAIKTHVKNSFGLPLVCGCFCLCTRWYFDIRNFLYDVWIVNTALQLPLFLLLKIYNRPSLAGAVQ